MQAFVWYCPYITRGPTKILNRFKSRFFFLSRDESREFFLKNGHFSTWISSFYDNSAYELIVCYLSSRRLCTSFSSFVLRFKYVDTAVYCCTLYDSLLLQHPVCLPRSTGWRFFFFLTKNRENSARDGDEINAFYSCYILFFPFDPSEVHTIYSVPLFCSTRHYERMHTNRPANVPIQNICIATERRHLLNANEPIPSRYTCVIYRFSVIRSRDGLTYIHVYVSRILFILFFFFFFLPSLFNTFRFIYPVHVVPLNLDQYRCIMGWNAWPLNFGPDGGCKFLQTRCALVVLTIDLKRSTSAITYVFEPIANPVCKEKERVTFRV